MMRRLNKPRSGRGLRGLAIALLMGLIGVIARPQPTSSGYSKSPQEVFKDLFVAVQTQSLFPDNKEFPDAIPREAPDEILIQYHAAHVDSRAALKRFVDIHFKLPAAFQAATTDAKSISIVGHIDALWSPLTRTTPIAPRYGSLLALPQPYVVPGGRFREIYYWDSYFTMLGLAESGRMDIVEGMVKNFAFLLDRYGRIPNGTRTYYLSRSQPPFFFEMVGLLSSGDPASAYARYLPQLKREYQFWMRGAAHLRPGSARWRVVVLPDGSTLNRYWDDRDSPRDESYSEDVELARTSGRPSRELFRNIRAAAESGWDFSSRWFADGHTRAAVDTTQIVPIDLNSLLFGLETAIADGCARQGNHGCSGQFRRLAAGRRVAIDRYLWNSLSGAYLDYRWTQRTAIKRISSATLYPLFVGMASQAQAEAVASITRTQLLKAGGLVTTPVDTGEQWDAPNGWAPLQWIAVTGLRLYGETSLAEAIGCRWMFNVNFAYARTGKLVEKYDVVRTDRQGGGGEYPLQDGFGWTNGVMRKLIAVFPAHATATRPEDCANSG